MTTLLKTVLSALLLLSLLVWIKYRFEHHLAPTTSGIHGELRGPKNDILLVGSSHTRQGYDADLLEKTTGRRAFIVAYDGVDLASMLPLLKTLLADPARRPELLVVEANGGNLGRGPELEEPRFFFDAPPEMKRSLIRDYLRTHHGQSAYVDAWTLIANRGSELILTWPLVHGAIDSLSYNGSYLNKNVPGIAPEVFPGLRVPLAGSVPNGDQAAALRQIVSVAAADGVKMIFADPPMPAPVEAQPQMVALQGRFKAIAAGAGIPYIDGAEGFPTADPAMFTDSNHLSTAGRELYTSRFAQAIKPELP
jgi:hypothetical protein